MKKLIGLLLCTFALFAGAPLIIMETSEGTIELTLKPDVAPLACENMIKLAESGKYENAPFHRIIPKFMIQGGDYERKNGTGGQSVFGKPFKDECSSKVRFEKPGLLAMANAGPGTNGSQFFITTAKTEWLQGKHTIFGEVTSGYDVVKKIEALGSPSGRPKKEVKIIKMTVKQ
ncbi:MAG: peptidylprolyl isomerase [Chlamydiales bacterium]|nr:peptidylprolyl isomerase [Chlamydiia bacterium]MCP5504383.1 peptidylprolyl isomerase [Chlamydiales bacterium]